MFVGSQEFSRASTLAQWACRTFSRLPTATKTPPQYLLPASHLPGRAAPCRPHQTTSSSRSVPREQTLPVSARRPRLTLPQLQSSLRNALASFGPRSRQYLMIQYMIAEYEAKLALGGLSLGGDDDVRR